MKAFHLFLAACLLAAQLLETGPAATNDPLIFRAQQRLTDLGYPVQRDGIYGRATRRAIKEFQQDRGLPETGRLDRHTREELGLNEGSPFRP